MDRKVVLKDPRDRNTTKRHLTGNDIRGKEVHFAVYSQMVSLDLTRMNLEAIEMLPETLEYLNLQNNNLKGLNVSNLFRLRVALLSDNNFDQLPFFKNCTALLSLHLNSNKLTSLPFEWLPPQLHELQINNNKLKQLPDLTSLTGLEELRCDRNPIKVIMGLPSSLQWFSCMNNQLQSLTLSYSSQLRYLDVSDNASLRELIHLPASLEFLFLHNCIVPALNLKHCSTLRYLGYTSKTMWPSLLLPDSLEHLEISQCHPFEIPANLKFVAVQDDSVGDTITESARSHVCEHSKIQKHILLQPILNFNMECDPYTQEITSWKQDKKRKFTEYSESQTFHPFGTH